MTYYNANVFVASPTRFAHDACLPASEFTPITHNGRPCTGHGDADPPCRQQNSPWNWAPLYGAPRPCYVCGQPVR